MVLHSSKTTHFLLTTASHLVAVVLAEKSQQKILQKGGNAK